MTGNLLESHLETLADVKDYYEAVQSVFAECSRGYCFHLVSLSNRLDTFVKYF